MTPPTRDPFTMFLRQLAGLTAVTGARELLEEMDRAWVSSPPFGVLLDATTSEADRRHAAYELAPRLAYIGRARREAHAAAVGEALQDAAAAEHVSVAEARLRVLAHGFGWRARPHYWDPGRRAF